MPFRVVYHTHGQFYTLFEVSPDPNLGIRRQAEELYGFTHVERLMDWDLTLSPDCFPRKARELNGRKKLYDILNMAPQYAVSERFKDLIEKYEPGVHQFSDPIEVTYKDGRPAEQRYFGMKLRRFLGEMIVPEMSPVLKKTRLMPAGQQGNAMPIQKYDGDQNPDKWYLDEEAIAGRHFWRSYQTFRDWWMSDEFVRALKKAKIVGMQYTHQLSGPRPSSWEDEY